MIALLGFLGYKPQKVYILFIFLWMMAVENLLCSIFGLSCSYMMRDYVIRLCYGGLVIALRDLLSYKQ